MNGEVLQAIAYLLVGQIDTTALQEHIRGATICLSANIVLLRKHLLLGMRHLIESYGTTI